uniref:Uncharacterized protein n=1 Tax=Lepeophtheirus salmonis TaxID=72036 RepID=A0A0K2T019_LEPSM
MCRNTQGENNNNKKRHKNEFLR